MDDVMDKKSDRINVSNYSVIQTIKYSFSFFIKQSVYDKILE